MLGGMVVVGQMRAQITSELDFFVHNRSQLLS